MDIPTMRRQTTIILGLAAVQVEEETRFNTNWECSTLIEDYKKNNITLDQMEMARFCMITDIMPSFVKMSLKHLYEAFQIKQTPKGRGILDLFTISAEGGGNYMVASDSGCTSPIILKQAIKQGMVHHVKSGSYATIQVAGGSKLPGVNYLCLLKLRKNRK